MYEYMHKYCIYSIVNVVAALSFPLAWDYHSNRTGNAISRGEETVWGHVEEQRFLRPCDRNKTVKWDRPRWMSHEKSGQSHRSIVRMRSIAQMLLLHAVDVDAHSSYWQACFLMAVSALSNCHSERKRQREGEKMLCCYTFPKLNCTGCACQRCRSWRHSRDRQQQ